MCSYDGDRERRELTAILFGGGKPHQLMERDRLACHNLGGAHPFTINLRVDVKVKGFVRTDSDWYEPISPRSAALSPALVCDMTNTSQPDGRSLVRRVLLIA